MGFHVQVYTGFVTCSHLYLKGRILRDGPLISKPSHGMLVSLLYTALRSMSREIPDVQLKCTYGETVYKTTSDHEGYFEVFENIEGIDNSPLKVNIEASLRSTDSVSTSVNLMKMRDEVPKGIISDIDDTIMVTGVTSFLKIRLILNTLFLNPFKRKSIDNAPQAFRSIVGNNGKLGPIVYLSNSPWNIFLYLKSFLDHNDFPKGILMLRDMGLQLLRSRRIKEYNKYLEIEKILKAFSQTNFTLIGDTGEKDFDIYKAITENHPDRISKIILNRVGNSKKENEIRNYISSNNLSDFILLVSGYSGFSKD